MSQVRRRPVLRAEAASWWPVWVWSHGGSFSRTLPALRNLSCTWSPPAFLDALCVSDFYHGCLAILQADWAHLQGLSLETTCVQWTQCPNLGQSLGSCSQTGTQAREPHRVQSESLMAILAQPVAATQGPFSTSLTPQAGTPLTCLTLPQSLLGSLQLRPLPGPGEPGEQRSLPESSGTLSVLSGWNARWQCAKERSPSRPTLRGSAVLQLATDTLSSARWSSSPKHTPAPF